MSIKNILTSFFLLFLFVSESIKNLDAAADTSISSSNQQEINAVKQKEILAAEQSAQQALSQLTTADQCNVQKTSLIAEQNSYVEQLKVAQDLDLQKMLQAHIDFITNMIGQIDKKITELSVATEAEKYAEQVATLQKLLISKRTELSDQVARLTVKADLEALMVTYNNDIKELENQKNATTDTNLQSIYQQQIDFQTSLIDAIRIKISTIDQSDAASIANAQAEAIAAQKAKEALAERMLAEAQAKFDAEKILLLVKIEKLTTTVDLQDFLNLCIKDLEILSSQKAAEPDLNIQVVIQKQIDFRNELINAIKQKMIAIDQTAAAIQAVADKALAEKNAAEKVLTDKALAEQNAVEKSVAEQKKLEDQKKMEADAAAEKDLAEQARLDEEKRLEEQRVLTESARNDQNIPLRQTTAIPSVNIQRVVGEAKSYRGSKSTKKDEKQKVSKLIDKYQKLIEKLKGLAKDQIGQNRKRIFDTIAKYQTILDALTKRLASM